MIAGQLKNPANSARAPPLLARTAAGKAKGSTQHTLQATAPVATTAIAA